MRMIVAGAPCSGKSTYVRQKMNRGELVYDYDILHSALSLQESHQHLDEILPYVLAARDAIFAELEANKSQAAWIITSTRKNAELETMRERFGAEVLLLEISRDEAHRRCDADQRPDAWHSYIDNWFDQTDINPADWQKARGETMNKKTYQAAIELKLDEGQEGQFRAVFSRFNVVDHDGDVTLPGAFEDGQKVRIAYWGHRWNDLPVGKGVIHANEEIAWVDGQFFLDTAAGLETYKTVKNLEELQEWSYGFDIVKSSHGEFEDLGEVRFLETLVVHEVSPVMLGAGIGTGTVDIKSAGANAGAEDGAENNDEGQTGDGVPSGASPQVYLTQIDVIEMES